MAQKLSTYEVSVTNQNDRSDDDFATAFSFAPPAILLVYEDTTAPSPSPSPISTSTPVHSAKPKPTPAQTSTPTEEKQMPGTDKVPVPGFELVISLFMLIIVAYLIRGRKGFK